MIYTGYFAKLKSLPEDVVPISICGKAPDWYEGLQYKKLAPKYDFFMKWKETGDNDYYIKCFNEQVLNKLDVDTVLSELVKLSNGKDVVLLCYETPDKFCHRHLVTKWLNSYGIGCYEYPYKC